MNAHPQRELVIVGGGILGLMVAHVAYRRGFRDITVYEDPGPLKLNSDTLRNHAWLQSGLLYAKSNFEAAKTLSEWGKRMLEEFGYLVPDAKGIFRFSDDGGESEREFKERVGRLQLSDDVRRLSQDQARNALGLFFLPGYIHYLVPDTPFDEAFLLHIARQRAIARRMHLRKAQISLLKRPDSNQGFVIQVGDRDIVESRYTVLCAGAGLPTLLGQLGLAHPLAVFRSALLRIGNGNVLRAPLLVDISEDRPSSGLSVIQHNPLTVRPKGCIVVGSKDRVRLRPNEVARRRVTRQEADDLRRLVPSLLRPSRRSSTRFVAGHKTEACDANGKPSVEPWISPFEEYPGMVAAVPGKATQALYVAEKVLDRLKGKRDRSNRKAPAPLLPLPPGESSDYIPRMHHHEDFDGVLDEIDDHDPDSETSGIRSTE